MCAGQCAHRVGSTQTSTVQVLPETLETSPTSFHIPPQVNSSVTSCLLPAADPVLVPPLWFADVIALLPGQQTQPGPLLLCRTCWLRVETSDCCATPTPPPHHRHSRACRQSRPHCSPPTVCDEAAILASGYKHTNGEGARGGGYRAAWGKGLICLLCH